MIFSGLICVVSDDESERDKNSATFEASKHYQAAPDPDIQK